MKERNRWPRILLVVGLIAMCVGAIDPLEGSLIILAGAGMAALGARLGHSRHSRMLAWSLVLVAVGTGLLWGMSARGGFGGESGRSIWWAVVLLPYPVGWVLGLIGATRTLREAPGPLS